MMKKTRLLMLCLCCILGMGATAQNADFQKAVEKFKTAKSASATVKKTVHKKSMTKTVVTTGEASLVKPDLVTISTNKGLDKLTMKGSKFTMTMNGKDHTTDSQKNPQFATFQKVLTSILNGGNTDISRLSDVSVSKSGNSLQITITPKAEKKQRMMFSSFLLVIDTHTSAFKLLRMSDRKGGYTDYEFSDFKFK